MSELMQQMLDAGAPVEAIIMAMRAIEERDEVDALRRRKAADRKALQRERDRSMSRDCRVTVTGQSDDNHDAPPSIKKCPPDPLKEITTPRASDAGEAAPIDADAATAAEPVETDKPKRRRRADEGAFLPKDWKPERVGDETLAREVLDRRGREWMRATLEEFRGHWDSASGQSARKRDWQAAWQKWIVTEDKRDGQHGDRSRQGGGRGAQKPRDAFSGVLQDIIDRADGDPDAPDG